VAKLPKGAVLHQVGMYLDQMREKQDIGQVAAQGFEVIEGNHQWRS
jgi:hypothetical protein